MVEKEVERRDEAGCVEGCLRAELEDQGKSGGSVDSLKARSEESEVDERADYLLHEAKRNDEKHGLSSICKPLITDTLRPTHFETILHAHELIAYEFRLYYHPNMTARERSTGEKRQSLTVNTNLLELQFIVAFGSTDFILWSLGGLGDVLDMIDNEGMVKIEEMKRPSLVALTGDVI